MWRTRVSAILGGIGLIMMMYAGCYLNCPEKLAYITAGGVMAGMALLFIASRLFDRAVSLTKQERARRKRLFQNWINCNIKHQYEEE